MNDSLNFVLKVLILSLVISLMIKYLGPVIAITENNVSALIIVMLLPLIITLFLSWKLLQKVSSSK